MDFKTELRRQLLSHNMTSSELSRRAGIPKQSISEWLRGTSPRNLNHLKKIANVFNLSIDQLCFGTLSNNLIIPQKGKFCVFGYDGFVKQANELWFEKLGWGKEIILGRRIIEFIHSEDWQKIQTLLQLTLLHKTSVDSFDVRFITNDQSILWFRWFILACPEDNQIFSACKDITAELPTEKISDSSTSFSQIIKKSLEFRDFYTPFNLNIKITSDLNQDLVYCKDPLIHQILLVLFNDLKDKNFNTSLHLFVKSEKIGLEILIPENFFENFKFFINLLELYKISYEIVAEPKKLLLFLDTKLSHDAH